MLDRLLDDRVAGAGATLSDAEFETSVHRRVRAVLSGLQRTDSGCRAGDDQVVRDWPSGRWLGCGSGFWPWPWSWGA